MRIIETIVKTFHLREEDGFARIKVVAVPEFNQIKIIGKGGAVEFDADDASYLIDMITVAVAWNEENQRDTDG